MTKFILKDKRIKLYSMHKISRITHTYMLNCKDYILTLMHRLITLIRKICKDIKQITMPVSKRTDLMHKKKKNRKKKLFPLFENGTLMNLNFQVGRRNASAFIKTEGIDRH